MTYGVTGDCSGRVRRERATVRSTIYNQIGYACVSVCSLYAPHQHMDGRVERGNDVHEVLSLITRSASAPAARTIVVSRPLLSSAVRSVSLFTSRSLSDA